MSTTLMRKPTMLELMMGEFKPRPINKSVYGVVLVRRHPSQKAPPSSPKQGK
jgi:hypothetical protein